MAFGLDPKSAGAVTAAVKKALTTPLIVKLSPNAPDLTAVAAACADSGADALSLVNTFKALAIDITRRRFVFDNVTAGLSGPAIKPIALRMVWEIAETVGSKRGIPVIGAGGIAALDDALEFLMAGAAAVQVGSATFAHPEVMTDIVGALPRYMAYAGITRLEELKLESPRIEGLC